MQFSDYESILRLEPGHKQAKADLEGVSLHMHVDGSDLMDCVNLCMYSYNNCMKYSFHTNFDKI